jgi:hypothetical protein
MGLGSLDTIGLADARERGRKAREQRLDGHDPIELRGYPLDLATSTRFWLEQNDRLAYGGCTVRHPALLSHYFHYP